MKHSKSTVAKESYGDELLLKSLANFPFTQVVCEDIIKLKKELKELRTLKNWDYEAQFEGMKRNAILAIGEFEFDELTEKHQIKMEEGPQKLNDLLEICESKISDSACRGRELAPR